MTNETVLLFSYGTLQSSTVQLETFGRELVGYKDKLPLHLTYAQADVPDAISPNTR
jgi:hypothetical protein